MADSNGLDLSRLEKKVDQLNKDLHSEIGDVKSDVSDVKATVKSVSEELSALKSTFEKMMEDQKKQAALQKAATEFVRVRQELDQKYGKYRTIRETMIGILQATDAALVKKTTISNVSEELMISAPNYWLAPCLVAVAAWIGNDRDLANRAIKEAVKRDEERTSLVMALICRRNNRTETCYEWLSVYFSNQNVGNFSEGTFLYVDAYINGVFGPDTRHMCDDYLQRWLDQLQNSNENFSQAQEEVWKNYCQNYVVSADTEFPGLKEHAKEYKGINSYLERVNSVESFSAEINEVNSLSVNQGELKKNIDDKLIELIERYNDDEAPLRKEERFYELVKKNGGDEDAARATVEAEEQVRRDRAKDLVGQMVEAIQGKGDSDTSQKKTAISFLSSYIEKGMDDFAKEKRDQFPEKITIDIDDWHGTTEDGSNKAQLMQEYVAFNESKREKEVQNIEEKKPTAWIVGAVLAVAIGLVSGLIPVGIVVAAICVIRIVLLNKTKSQRIEETNNRYQQIKEDGQKQISTCVDQWIRAKERVAVFESTNKRIA